MIVSGSALVVYDESRDQHDVVEHLAGRDNPAAQLDGVRRREIVARACATLHHLDVLAVPRSHKVVHDIGPAEHSVSLSTLHLLAPKYDRHSNSHPCSLIMQFAAIRSNPSRSCGAQEEVQCTASLTGQALAIALHKAVLSGMIIKSRQAEETTGAFIELKDQRFAASGQTFDLEPSIPLRGV